MRKILLLLLLLSPSALLAQTTVGGSGGSTGNLTVDGNLTVLGTCTGCAASAGNLAFSQLTTGTNTVAAMTVGAGASVIVTSTGVFNLTGITGANLFTLPSIAAAAPTTAGAFAYDSTNARLVFGNSSTTSILPWFASGTPVNGNCVTWSGTLGLLSSAACGSGGSVTLQTNGTNNSSQTTLNFITSSTNSVGLTVTPSNSTSTEKFEVTGASYTGNAATSTALASTPSNCGANVAASGVAANGNAVGCFTPSGVSSAPGFYYVASGGNVVTAANSCISGGGGDIWVTAPGTYTVASTIPVGTPSTAGTKVNCVLILGAGVNLHFTITNHTPGIQVFDGSAVRGLSGGRANSGVPAGATLSCGAGATMTDFLENGDQTGLQESLQISGLYFNGSGCAFDLAHVHIRGTGANTRLEHLNLNTLSGPGLLIDGPDNQAVTVGTGPAQIASVVGNGTTVTVTLNPTQTNDPDATGLSLGQSFTMSGCTGGTGTFNGTFPTSNMSSATSFTYLATGNGTATACTYSPVTSLNITSGVAVVDGIDVSGGGATGSKPIVLTDAGSTIGSGVQISDFKFTNINAEGADPAGGTGCTPNTSGTSAQTPCWGDFTIDGLAGDGFGTTQATNIEELHMEAVGNNTVIGLYIRDAHDVHVRGVSCTSSGGDCVKLSSSLPKRLYNIQVENINNPNWINDVNDAVNSRVYTRATYGNSMLNFHYGASSSGDCTAGNVMCASDIWDGAVMNVSPDFHMNQFAANTDYSGVITFGSGAVTATYSFNKNWVTGVNCSLTPISDVTANGAYWTTTSVSTLTAHVHTGSGTPAFVYSCVGAPN